MTSSAKFVVIDCYLDDVGGARNVTPHFPNSSVLRAAHEPIPERIEADGIIITGSAASVLAAPQWATELEQCIGQTAEENTPILGLCFGHQILARALFGESAVRTAITPELGWGQIETIDDDALFVGVPKAFKCFLSHKDEVNPECSAFRDGAQLLGQSDDCPVETFRAINRPLWGVQFHAEMGLKESRGLVESRLGSKNCDAQQILQRAAETTELANQMFANFAGYVAHNK